jgi:hypothetical protein
MGFRCAPWTLLRWAINASIELLCTFGRSNRVDATHFCIIFDRIQNGKIRVRKQLRLILAMAKFYNHIITAIARMPIEIFSLYTGSYMQPAGRKTIAILLFFDRPVEYKTRRYATARCVFTLYFFDNFFQDIAFHCAVK